MCISVTKKWSSVYKNIALSISALIKYPVEGFQINHCYHLDMKLRSHQESHHKKSGKTKVNYEAKVNMSEKERKNLLSSTAFVNENFEHFYNLDSHIFQTGNNYRC